MAQTAVQPPPEAAAAADATMAPVLLPTIDRSLQRPVWHDSGALTAKLLRGNNDETSFVSTCAADYIKHALPVIQDLRGKVSALVTTAESAPFAPQTEQRDNYTPFSKPRVRFRTRRGQIQIPRVPLEKNSCYQVEYNRKLPDRRPAYKPREQDYSSSEPFSNSSIYRDSYKKWESLPAIGALPVTVSAPPCLSEDPVPAPEGFEPERSLNGATDYRGNFRRWAVQRSETVPARYRPPREPMSLETSYSCDFGPRPQPKKVTASRPPENDLSMKGAFENMSIYREDFTKKEPRPSSRGILQNRNSLMYNANGSCGPEEWFKGADMQPFLEHPLHMFYQT